MIKPPILSTVTPELNPTVIASLMETMACQLDDSADTLLSSPMGSVKGNTIALAATGLTSRASQIRELAESVRTSGYLDFFDAACELAGWHPSPQALQSLHALH